MPVFCNFMNNCLNKSNARVINLFYDIMCIIWVLLLWVNKVHYFIWNWHNLPDCFLNSFHWCIYYCVWLLIAFICLMYYLLLIAIIYLICYLLLIAIIYQICCLLLIAIIYQICYLLLIAIIYLICYLLLTAIIYLICYKW